MPCDLAVSLPNPYAHILRIDATSKRGTAFLRMFLGPAREGVPPLAGR